MPDTQAHLQSSELGRRSRYESHYNPALLFPIPRQPKREEIDVNPHALPFYGWDCWNHYEVSWLNEKGKPLVATARIVYDCRTPFIIESKSMKLYFNSLNNTVFHSPSALRDIIEADLKACLAGEVQVSLTPLENQSEMLVLPRFQGENIDALDIECSVYEVEPSFLCASGPLVEETLCSDLLKSNCLVTHQPDWGSVQIEYKGLKIDRAGLLRYLVSFRNHDEFHEQCIERIFVDIGSRCKPERLTVYGRYTRRGGLDINPFRSSFPPAAEKGDVRLIRQ